MPNWNARGVPLENEPEPDPARSGAVPTVPLMLPGPPDRIGSNPVLPPRPKEACPIRLSRLKMLETSAVGSIERRSLKL